VDWGKLSPGGEQEVELREVLSQSQVGPAAQEVRDKLVAMMNQIAGVNPAWRTAVVDVLPMDPV
jgi:hypothetical protein